MGKGIVKDQFTGRRKFGWKLLHQRFLCFALALLLSMGGLSVSLADQTQDEAAVHGVDAVVVLDMSSSMKSVDQDNRNILRGNDINDYRIDATSMLIGMLDMNGSRVAIVPFAGYPMEVTELTPVQTLQDRRRLIEEIRKNNKIEPNTNIGAALMRANQILADRGDTSNQPMIVLLTDGENEISEGKNSLVANVRKDYRWNADTQEIIENGSQRYNTALANTVTREAVECAKAKGYPIYTVALNTNPSKEPVGGMSLNNISRETGVSMGALQTTKENASLLPEFFANILADKIGSSVQMTMRPTLVSGNTYEVIIPIVNESVQETNVIIPVLNKEDARTQRQSASKIDPATIRVLNGDREPGEPTVTVLYEKGFFAMIKIKNPKMTGVWKLRFESEEDPSAISFNLLYNYDIKLAATVTNHNQSELFYKNDTLVIQTRFVDDHGNPSPDSELYKDHADIVGDEYKSWAKIVPTCSLFQTDDEGRISDEPLRTETMEANSVQNFFHQEINLLDFEPKLKAGKYILRLATSGAGLFRQIDIPLEFQNHEPHSDPYEETIHVNPVGSDDRWTVESTSGNLQKTLTQIVIDEDQDEMVYDFQPIDNQVAEMVRNGNTIQFTTRSENGKVKPGDVSYELFYNDGELNQPKSVQITLHIVSDVDVVLETYEPEITIMDPDDGDREKTEFLKNKPLKVAVRLKNLKTGGYADEELIEKILPGTLRILQNGNLWREVELTRNGDALEYVDTTENGQAVLTIQAELKYFGTLPEKTIQVLGGHAPVAVTRGAIQLNREGEGIPGFLRSLIGESTPEDDPNLTLDERDLFSDDDNDRLDYGKPRIVVPGTDEVISALNVSSTEDHIYRVQYVERATSLFHYTYEGELRMDATDGDGQTGTFVQKITVVDLYYKMMTYLVMILIAIAILTILCLIIHQIRKPVFARLNMTIVEEPSLYETSSEELSPVKTPLNLNRLGVDSDMAAKHNISMELLQNTIVKPLRSISSVAVRFKKQVSGHEIMLDNVRMKPKKWYTWRIGQELTVRSLNGEGLVAMKLEDRRDLGGENDMDEFGKEEDWVSTGFEEKTGNASEKKKTHRVSRKKAAPQKEEKAESGSSDDFDF